MDKKTDQKSVRLILVEDSDSDAFLVGEAAKQLAYNLHVTRFSTAARAIADIERAMEDCPDGVLLDLNLPGGSGLDVLRWIRANERCRKLKAVVMTSSISSRDRDAAEQMGIEAFMVKPSDYDQFLDTMSTVLQLLRAEG